MLKRSLMILLLISLILSVSACSQNKTDIIKERGEDPAFEKYEVPTTLNIVMGVDPNYKSYTGETPANNPWIKTIKAKLNVNIHIDWFATHENMDQRIDLAISSNVLPDAMVVSPYQFNQMVEADELEDLTKAYEEYASPIMKRIIEGTNAGLKEDVMINGKMLALPSANPEDFSMMWIRKDWLDRLGLAPPSTMKELESVAKAFVEQDPDGNGQKDTIGIAAGTSLYDEYNAGPGSFNLNPIFSAYDSYPGFWLKGKNGMPVYGSIQPETRTALAALRELYVKGLIDREMGIRETEAEVVIEGKAGIFFAPSFGGDWPIPEALKNNPRANWQAYALPLDIEGKFNVKIFRPTQSYIVVRKGYEHPEAIIKIANLTLRDREKYGDVFQPLQNMLVPRDEVAFSVRAIQDVMAGRQEAGNFQGKEEYPMLASDLETIYNVKRPPYDNTDIQYWNLRDGNFRRAYSLLVGGKNLYDPNLNKVYSIYNEGRNSFAKQWKYLADEEMDVFTQIIMGVVPLETFDQWVQNWKLQGGEQITDGIAKAISP
ncbi:extracellular solute-binding protein [Paenibacillus sp. FSL H7-0716]|uniref:Sugar ABC transporter substrate-binding protein n=1 Tax=Paenibacillus odorifer TaxID=189426 RepID=A0AB36JE62_9BACL|nr:extracellular solute-binding protein [Paenibacillus odorifer]OME18141.1 sugar ABC transporter substrate-binding protein [Paenibacillus odorifer]